MPSWRYLLKSRQWSSAFKAQGERIQGLQVTRRILLYQYLF
jgi:hypothetical protein